MNIVHVSVVATIVALVMSQTTVSALAFDKDTLRANALTWFGCAATARALAELSYVAEVKENRLAEELYAGASGVDLVISQGMTREQGQKLWRDVAISRYEAYRTQPGLQNQIISEELKICSDAGILDLAGFRAPPKKSAFAPE